MTPGYTTKRYTDQTEHTHFQKKTPNGVQFFLHVLHQNTSFLNNQQGILQDFIGEVLELIDNDERMLIEDVRKKFENLLQNINVNLETFASKISSEEFFWLRGVVWIVYQGTLMASMIWDSSLLILRNDHIHYKMHNEEWSQERISIFSDFVEGELELDDIVVLMWVNYKSVLHSSDVKQLDSVIATTDVSMLDILEEILLAKVDPEVVWFLTEYNYRQATENVRAFAYRPTRSKKYSHVYKTIQRFVFKHKYSLTVVVLGIIVVLLGYHIVNDMFSHQSNLPTVETNSGTVTITINSIREDIEHFEKLAPTSPEKSRYYKKITDNLTLLKTKWMWLEDVRKLEKVVEKKYLDGFNVLSMTDIDHNIDIVPVYDFSTQEKETMGSIKMLLHDGESYHVAGSQWAMLGGINEDIRGTLVNYNIESPVQDCSFDISRQGMYCYTEANTIFHITKWTVAPLEIKTSEEDQENATKPSFDTPITDIEVFPQINSMYVLHNDATQHKEGKYITRYSNVPWSMTMFAPWSPYILESYVDGTWNKEFSFSNFVIDGTFLVWEGEEAAMYQFWREPNSVWSIVYQRSISMEWWDTVHDVYSPDSKILTSINSKYVYVFDKEHQTFTVYQSSPLKTNDRFKYSYNLLYVFRMKFDFEATKEIIDVSVGQKWTENPYLHLVNNQGIYEVSLWEFINEYKEK